jgi:hypothetical protein
MKFDIFMRYWNSAYEIYNTHVGTSVGVIIEPMTQNVSIKTHVIHNLWLQND